jgi:hypothetical protein
VGCVRTRRGGIYFLFLKNYQLFLYKEKWLVD